jgi:NADP-dependent 3-hydroxy acid dehydrogenase YdfG
MHLVGRTEASLDAVARRIRAVGGTARIARVDVQDRVAVERHASAVATAGGGIDVCSMPPPTTMSKAHRSSTCNSRTSCAP